MPSRSNPAALSAMFAESATHTDDAGPEAPERSSRTGPSSVPVKPVNAAALVDERSFVSLRTTNWIAAARLAEVVRSGTCPAPAPTAVVRSTSW